MNRKLLQIQITLNQSEITQSSVFGEWALLSLLLDSLVIGFESVSPFFLLFLIIFSNYSSFIHFCDSFGCKCKIDYGENLPSPAPLLSTYYQNVAIFHETESNTYHFDEHVMHYHLCFGFNLKTYPKKKK